ncbi:MAG: 7-carboxy-7-deazaguanine synthase QueE [Cyclobacteriaceae bacterium]
MSNNIQTLSKSFVHTELPIMESFYTIQGEGAHTGTAAYFIRTGGCDVGCVWCDVKESWNADDHPKKAVISILDELRPIPVNVVVITGGEPLMYNMTSLTLALQENGYKTHVETSGVYELSGDWDWICFSPKKFKKPLPEFYDHANELKVIIYNVSDFAWAEGHAQKMNKNAKLFLQPEWSKKDQMIPEIVEYVKKNPEWKISLQTHKYLDIP